MDLLILHLQYFFQTFQVLFDVFIRRQSVLQTAESVRGADMNLYSTLVSQTLVPGAVTCSSYHYLVICALAKSFFESLCSVPKAQVLKGQRVHLILVIRPTSSTC